MSALTELNISDLDIASGGNSAPTCSSNGKAVVCTCPGGSTMIIGTGEGGVTMTCVTES